MRQVTEQEYSTAKAALAAYEEYSKPYVQRNGWTVIPADAPRPLFNGEELTTDAINAHSTNVELYELERDKPEKLSAYLSPWNDFPEIATTWTGEQIGKIVYRGAWQQGRNYRFRSIAMQADFGGLYRGRETDSKQFVNFKRARTKSDDTTPVLFRVDVRNGGDVVAIFPTIDESRGRVSCYAHIGQHSACSLGWYRTTRPATPDEYAALKRELELAPYRYSLKVLRRWPQNA